VIFSAAQFVFQSPAAVVQARRILLKPNAAYALPPPISTSREILETVIAGIRQASDADILLLEGAAGGESMHVIYRELGYDFPRVLTLDVRDCILVEVENPLARPFALSTIWVPNVVLSCDYLITVAPFKILGNNGSFSIMNLLSLLPASKYRGELHSLGIHRVVADLYFTLPFDLGIIDARHRLISGDDPTRGEVEEYGKVFVGEPFEVDLEASEVAGLQTEYLGLIEEARGELEP